MVDDHDWAALRELQISAAKQAAAQERIWKREAAERFAEKIRTMSDADLKIRNDATRSALGFAVPGYVDGVPVDPAPTEPVKPRRPVLVFDNTKKSAAGETDLREGDKP